MERPRRDGERSDLLKAEEERGESMTRLALLASIVDSSNDAIITKTLDGIVTSWNPAAQTIYGYTAKEIIGKPISLLAHKDQADQMASILKEIRDGHRVEHHETVRVKKDGTPIYVSLTVSPLHGADGKLIGASSIARDVTETKRIQRELVETKNFLDNILQSAIKYSIIGKDLDNCILSWNEGARRNYGYAAEEVLGKSSEMLHAPEAVKSGAVKKLLETASEKGLAEGEFERVRKDGSRFVANVVVTRRTDLLGNPIGYLVISNDISAQKRAERTVQEVGEYAESIVATVREPLLVLDADMKVVSANRSFYQTFKVRAEEAQGRLVYDLGNRQWDIPKLRELLEEVLPKNTSVDDFEVKHVFETIGRRIMLLNARRIYHEANKTRMILLAIEDITERRKAERDLARHTEHLEVANRELEAFSFAVSHDLRAPLRHIDGFTGLLAKHLGSSLDATGRRYLTKISDSARQMGELIDDLLSFSRLGHAELRSTRLDLSALTKEVLRLLEPETVGRDIEWVMSPLPAAQGDPLLLRLVFQNLIGNALKYTRPNRRARIEIGVIREEAELIFSIRDNGVGFDMRYVDRLFGVFQRLHSGAEFEGTGIGLANVKRIIHRHGGRVWAEGAVGEGACFYFSLPDLA